MLVAGPVDPYALETSVPQGCGESRMSTTDFQGLVFPPFAMVMTQGGLNSDDGVAIQLAGRFSIKFRVWPWSLYFGRVLG